MISVVIPLYNKENSVRATLESVRAQSYQDWECIVVDDGSTDKSREVAEQFKIEDFRFKILSQANAGVSAARNAGIMAAKGEYVAFLDGDDLWAPNYLDILAALIADYPDVGLYSIGYEEIDTDEIPPCKTKIEGHYRGAANPWTGKIRLWTGSSSSSSRERLIKVGLFDTRMTHGEDIDMWWRLILDGGLVVDTAICAYYCQDTENRAMNKVIPLEKHIPYYIDKYVDARAKNADFRRFFDEQMIYRLYPYLFDKKYRKEAKMVAQRLDYSQLKFSMRLRMLFPHLYRLFTRR